MSPKRAPILVTNVSHAAMVFVDMSPVSSDTTKLKLVSPIEWNRRLIQLQMRSTPLTSPVLHVEDYKWRHKLRRFWKKNWKIVAVVVTYWVLWSGFSFYVIINQ